MKNGLRLWWKDYKETWKFAKRHPFIFIICMTFLIVVFKLLGM